MKKNFIIITGIILVLVFVLFLFTVNNEQDKEAVEDALAPEAQYTERAIPEPLNLAMPEHIEDPFYPCANLNVSSETQERRSSFSGAANTASERGKKMLNGVTLPYEVHRGDENIPAVALTIDTGTGGGDGVDELLQLAAHYNLPLTFFLTGCWVLENPELTQRIAEEGHSIGNHSMTHRNLGAANDEIVEWEIEEASRIIYETTRITPAMFRKPLYAGGERVANIAGDLGMVSVQGWPDLGDTGGWVRGATHEGVYSVIERKTAPGAIWVLHNLSVADLGAFEDIVRMHLEEGYELVRVEEMVGK